MLSTSRRNDPVEEEYHCVPHSSLRICVGHRSIDFFSSAADVMVEARGVQFADEDLCDRRWTQLEEVLVASCHEENCYALPQPTLSCATAETKNDRSPLAVVGGEYTRSDVIQGHS